jgi:hypothetical protein
VTAKTAATRDAVMSRTSNETDARRPKTAAVPRTVSALIARGSPAPPRRHSYAPAKRAEQHHAHRTHAGRPVHCHHPPATSRVVDTMRVVGAVPLRLSGKLSQSPGTRGYLPEWRVRVR